MKEIHIDGKIESFMNVVPMERMNEQRKATAIANMVARRVDIVLGKIRDKLVIEIYNEVLDELRDK